jgi:hypothetical protein
VMIIMQIAGGILLAITVMIVLGVVITILKEQY